MRARLSVALHAVSVRRGKKWALKDISLDLRGGGDRECDDEELYERRLRLSLLLA